MYLYVYNTFIITFYHLRYHYMSITYEPSLLVKLISEANFLLHMSSLLKMYSLVFFYNV